MMRVAACMVMWSVAIATMGCREPNSVVRDDVAGPSPPQAGVTLVVQVAGDEELAEALILLRGEWKAFSGGELEVSSSTLDELKAGPAGGDLVIFPSRYLGTLVERGELRPIRDSVLESESLALSDIYPAIRNAELSYGGRIFGLPLGSPPLMACYTSNPRWSVPEEALPTTWQLYRSWINLDGKEPRSTAVPRSGRDAAVTLLARGLSYTEPHRRNEALFDPETMKSRIDEPAFVRGLAEIAEEIAGSKTDVATFAEAIELVVAGKAAAALGWPGLASSPHSAAAPARIQFAPLPRSETAYSRSQSRWVNQQASQSLVLLGVEGRLVGVTAASRNAVSAFKLAQWLVSGDAALRLSSASRATLWFRASQSASHSSWVRRPAGAGAGSETALDPQEIAGLLTSDAVVLIPRIPAIDEYLDVLGEEIAATDPGVDGAQRALSRTAAKWEKITERLGLDSQRSAYRRHLGIDEMEIR